MADGIRGAITGLGEAIATPVKQEVKDVFKETIQSITGSTSAQDPQEEAKRKAQEEVKKRNIQAFLNNLAQQEQALKAQRAKEAQEKAAARQTETQQKEAKKVEMMQKRQQRENIDVANKQRATERKVGTG